MDNKMKENKECEVTGMIGDQEKVVERASCEIEPVQEIVGEESNLVSNENEEESVDIESFSKVSFANVSLAAKATIKDLINCKTKFDVKLSTTELKLKEATKHSEILQNRIDELASDVSEMESRRALQNIDMEILKEDCKSVPDVIKTLSEKCNEIEVRLNEASDRKNRYDEEFRKLDLEEEEMKKHHQEKMEMLKRKLAEEKKIVENNRKMRRESLEEQNRLLLEGRNTLKEKQDEKNKILARIDDKKKILEDKRLVFTKLDEEKNQLCENRRNMEITNFELTYRVSALQREIETNEIKLKESQETLSETNKNYEESKKQLDVVKNKNTELKNIVIKNKEKLETLKSDGQKQLDQLKESCDIYSNQINSIKTHLANIKEENVSLKQQIYTFKKILTDLNENISSNKAYLDDLKAKDHTDSELFASAQADLDANKQKLSELINLEKDLQNTHENLKEHYEARKYQFDLVEKIQKELQETQEYTMNLLKEKQRIDTENKEKLQNEFESFMAEQEALINDKQNILEAKKVELKNLENKIAEINVKAVLKKQFADQTYEKCDEIEKDNLNLTSVLNRMKMEARNPRRDLARATNPQRGILKSPVENVPRGEKKVTFEAALRDRDASVASQDSFDQMFKQFLDTDNVDEPKTAGELVDLTAVSPPQKDN